MKKRILALFLCLVLSFALVACGGNETPSTDSGSGTNSQSSVGSDTNTDTSDTNTDTSDSDEPKLIAYDPSLEHKIIACDIRHYGIVVFDLNACNGDLQNLTNEEAVVWEWRSEEDPNCKGTSKIKGSISGVKYRYSEYYKKDVVVACATYGWVGIIDYETCSVIWESTDPILGGVHSVEMLPNGDVVAGVSNKPGAVAYFPVTSGKTESVHSIDSLWCHGVCWDPENEWLWVLEDSGVFAAQILNMGTEKAKIIRMSGCGDKFVGDGGGHAFAPVGGEPGKYWASAGGLWIFDSETEELNKAGSPYSYSSIKGMCSFADGTIVQSCAGLCGTNGRSFGSDGFRIITKQLTEGKVKKVKEVVTKVHFTEREFYKVQAFTKNYQ